MSDPSSSRVRRLVVWIYVLFFASGALGLAYQVLWLRRLHLIFGSTVHATSAVLTVFFGGLALGSWLFGRLIDRRERMGLLWYAACEMAIGVYAFVTLPLFEAVERLYLPWYKASNFSPTVLVIGAMACSVVVLLIPTTLMGATLPLLSRYVVRTVQERGVKVASLYGINTIGAMAGTLFVYFIGLQRLGWLATLQCAGLLNILLAVVARSLNRNLQALGYHDAPAAPVEESAVASSVGRVVPSVAPAIGGRLFVLLMIGFGLSGAAAMIYEVAWTRSLSLVLGSSIYAFIVMLTTFLGGLALGSLVSGWVLRRQAAELQHFVLLEWCLGLYGLFSISLFALLPDWFVGLWPLFGRTFAGLSWLQFVLSMSIMALPTFFMGLLFPIVADLVTGQLQQFGRRLGLTYAVNTVGGIVGSFCTGFWLIPTIGIAWTLAAAAGLNIAAGLLVYLAASHPHNRTGRLGFAVGLALILGLMTVKVIVPSWQRQALTAGVYLNAESYQQTPSVQAVESQYQLLFYRESLNATVSVHQNPQNGQRFLKVGGKTDASTGIDMGTQVLSGTIPLLVHGHAANVLVIGLGSGVTVGSVGRYSVERIDCAELDPAVIEAARYFSDVNYRIHEDPRVRLFAADGRNILLATDQRYDAIISEPSNPWMAGLAYLFTDEFYKLAKSRLAPGGVMCQWVQLYRIFPMDVKAILKTFQSNFPYTTVWSTIPGDLILVGSMEPQRLDRARLEAIWAQPAIRDNLGRIGITHPRALLEAFWMAPDDVRRLTADIAWLHQDDKPFLEFSAPKALYVGPTFEINYEGLRGFRSPPTAIAPDVADAPQDGAYWAAIADFYLYRGEIARTVEALENAVAAEPNNAALWLRLGEQATQRSMHLKAREAFNRALAIEPSRVETYYALAQLLRRQSEVEQALAAYERAGRLRAPDGAVSAEIAHTFGRASRDARHSLIPRSGLASLANEDGAGSVGRAKQWLASAEYWRSAVSQAEELPPGLLASFADALRRAGLAVEAEHAAAVGLERFPGTTDLMLVRAEALMDLNRPDQASPWFARLLARMPQHVEAHIGLARVALNAGLVEAAREHLLSALRFDPYNKKALELLSSLPTTEHPSGSHVTP